jgi:hypothetical protein
VFLLYSLIFVCLTILHALFAADVKR